MSILKKYQPESVKDMQSVFKEIFGLMFENMFKGEMNYHLGYDNNSKEPFPLL